MPQKLRGDDAINHAMIARQRQRHPFPGHYISILHHRFLHDRADSEDGGFGRVNDGVKASPHRTCPSL